MDPTRAVPPTSWGNRTSITSTGSGEWSDAAAEIAPRASGPSPSEGGRRHAKGQPCQRAWRNRGRVDVRKWPRRRRRAQIFHRQPHARFQRAVHTTVLLLLLLWRFCDRVVADADAVVVGRCCCCGCAARRRRHRIERIISGHGCA